MRRRTRLLLVPAATLALLFLLEGGASAFLLLRATWGSRPPAERLHTEYDEELGWIHRPDVRLEDLYGPGASLTTNAQRLRASEVYAEAEPAGRVRALCAGDSFTLGYGVGDDETWSAVLERIEPRLQTVNLGQGGYGVDQAFLWYRRVAADLEHRLVLFAFITFDFVRMQNALNAGILRRAEGGFVRRHPRPRTSYLPWARRELDPAGLAAVRLVRGLLPAPPREGREGPPLRPEETAEHALALFRALAADLRERGGVPVLVHLPMATDRTGEASAEWRHFLRTVSAGAPWHHVDLIEDLRELPVPRALSLFLQPEEVAHPGAAGHLNVRGNEFVAERLRARLLELEDVRRLLEREPR